MMQDDPTELEKLRKELKDKELELRKLRETNFKLVDSLAAQTDTISRLTEVERLASAKIDRQDETVREVSDRVKKLTNKINRQGRKIQHLSDTSKRHDDSISVHKQTMTSLIDKVEKFDNVSRENVELIRLVSMRIDDQDEIIEKQNKTITEVTRAAETNRKVKDSQVKGNNSILLSAPVLAFLIFFR